MIEENLIEVTVPENFFKNPNLNQEVLKKLAEDFKDYVTNPAQEFLGIKISHKTFGKEEALMYPIDETGETVLYKVHINPDFTGSKTKHRWANKSIGNTNKTSDSILVYTRGEINPDHYILLLLLHPKGHEKLSNHQLMKDVLRLARFLRKDV